MSNRRICLAIGIGNAGGGLDYLGGAINGARAMHEWAQALGYQSCLLTDEDTKHPVDIARVRQALETLLPPGTQTQRLILYFAGHGLIAGPEEGLWLLNDWHSELHGVGIEVLKRRLRNFGVEHLAIIADACRKLPADMKAAALSPNPVLGQGFTRPEADLLIDRFTASQDGRAAYMIPGATLADDRCIFSGVLLEGLWGLSDEAFSQRATSLVISSSLAHYLRTQVPVVAARYELKMHPQAAPGFPENDDVYFDREHPPAVKPTLGPWPTPRNAAIERAMAQRQGEAESTSRTAGSLTVLLGSLLGASPSEALRTGIGKLATWRLADLLSGLMGSSPPSPGEPSPPQPPLTAQRPDGITEADWEGLKARLVLDQGLPMDDNERHQVRWLAERGNVVAQAQAATVAAQTRQAETLALIRSAAVPSGLLEGLVVAGAPVVRLWGGTDFALSLGGGAPVWSASCSLPFGEARQVVVELADGHFAPCTLMSGMVTRLAVAASGAVGLVMQPGYSQWEEIARSIDLAETAIARLEGGALAVAEATDLATGLRMIKHVNPVLGVLAAYMYDTIGDLDSIRRMAFYYTQHQQAVPFDIVFLADLQTRDRGDGVLEVMLPALAQRAARTVAESRFVWTTEATPSARGLVAGRLPWLRQGWPYIDSPSDAERLMTGRLSELSPGLAPSRFTTFEAGAGAALANLLNLEVRT